MFLVWTPLGCAPSDNFPCYLRAAPRSNLAALFLFIVGVSVPSSVALLGSQAE